ncbi:MAG: hypothetical protein AAGD28_28855 [Bacteroidota bacterium]
MKKLSLILSFLFLLPSIQSQAQEDYYSTNGVAFSNLEQDIIAVSFVRVSFNSRERSFYIVVNQGQACMNATGMLNRLKFVVTCGGLKDKDGELVETTNYVRTLNLFEKQGWELLSTAVNTRTNGQSDPESHEYIFRKKDPLSQ